MKQLNIYSKIIKTRVPFFFKRHTTQAF